MVNKELVRTKAKSPTCLISIDRTMNNTVSPPIVAKGIENLDNSLAVRKSKRLGRGAVNSGLTCECGVFAAMACGEWPTQRVSILGWFFPKSCVFFLWKLLVFCAEIPDKMNK